MAGNLSSVVPVENQSSLTIFDRKNQFSLTSIKYKWDVEYCRFFNFPRNLSSTSTNLKPLAKHRTRFRGTWMSSSSIASLNLIDDASNPETILIVFLGETIVVS
ncbi:hypothetical protein BVC80_233g45 [Macleaya cordata]|uniref:Poor homologous synapsis 1 PH domain-containing protein n=1 Tax=Macleaya cordata TaxID=56857 RepID=A0A200RB08_MACCD|nr:hypothetical protein BVC80_233g45 [Macleaya cordata]